MEEEGVPPMLREVRKKRAHEDIVKQIRSLVEKGQPVEFGQPLFKVDTRG